VKTDEVDVGPFNALRTILECDDAVDAVIISEELPYSIEQAAAIARQHSAAPLILFCHSAGMLDESRFDRVYSSFVPPDLWVSETATLIERGCSTGRCPTSAI
jgi:hypothetical protein